MYAKILNNEVVKYPYQWTDFEADNNNTNYGYPQPDLLTIFPQTDIANQGYTVVSVASVTQPIINKATQSVAEDIPTLINEVWTQNWVVTTLTSDQQATLTTNEVVKIRQQRNAKLTACDWTQIADAPVDKTAWSTYRQALRDLTKESGFPWTITWPTEPA
jgi:hypothetical protein